MPKVTKVDNVYQAITSGDVDADWTVKMNFSANGISGGAADPLPMSFILQRTSGVV